MRCLSTFSASFALASAAAFFSTLPVNASPLAPSLKPRQDDSSPSGPKFIPSPVKHSGSLSSCHGYKASSIRKHSSGLEATLKLIGQPCHAYGTDYEDLHLRVNYDTEDRLHVTISDAEGKAHVVPKDVWPRPADSSVHSSKSNLKFEYVENPFSFSVTRNDGEVLFDTKGEPLVFEDQYIRVATGLPEDPNIYGLGDHNDPFRLPTANVSFQPFFPLHDFPTISDS